MKKTIEISCSSLNKHGENISGNIINKVYDETGATVIFADGEGDGTGASVSSAFITRMAEFLLKKGKSVKSVINTIAETYSDTDAGLIPGIAVLRLTTNGNIAYSAMNMPDPIVLMRGRPLEVCFDTYLNGNRCMCFSDFIIKKGSMLIAFNQGLLESGDNSAGLNSQVLRSYLQSAYAPTRFNVSTITRLLVSAANSLEYGRPKHDISVLAMQLTESADAVQYV